MLSDYENKMMQKNQIKVKLNAPLRGLIVGSVIKIDTDKNGTPLDAYWRNRLKDSAIDQCIEILLDTKPEKKSTKKGSE